MIIVNKKYHMGEQSQISVPRVRILTNKALK
jgi:hypothetical protein